MRTSRRRRGFVLVTMTLVLMILFILLFSLMTLSSERTRLVRLNTDRTILAAEARAGLAEAAHYLDNLKDWNEAPDQVPSEAASLNSGAGISHRLEILSASVTEVQVRSVAWRESAPGRKGASRHVDATFRRRGISFPSAAAFGASGVHLNSNARTDSYDSTQGGYESSAGTDGDVGSNATADPVTLDPNAEVKGNLIVRDGAEPIVRGNASYESIDYQQEPWPLPLLAPPDGLTSGPSQGNVAASGQTILSPGRYGALTSSAGSEIVLNGGVYLFDSIDISQNSRVRVVNGDVTIYFRGDVSFGSNTDINTDAPRQDSTTLMLFSDTSFNGKKPPTVLLNSNCDFVGAIYNPKGNVTLESNTQVFGSVTGDTVRMRSFAQSHLDKSLLLLDLAPDPGGGMKLSSWASW